MCRSRLAGYGSAHDIQLIRESGTRIAILSTPLIFHSYKDGLGNRLRALVGYRALADMQDRPFLLCWERHHHCAANFDDIFDTGQVDLISRRSMEKLRKAGAAIESDTSWFTRIGRTHNHGGGQEHEFVARSMRYLTSVRLKPDLASIVAEQSEALQLDVVLGLHVRYTDNINAFSAGNGPFEDSRTSRLDGFLDCVDGLTRETSTEKFFLATDNPEVEQLFRIRYGTRVLTYGKQFRRPRTRFRRLWLSSQGSRTSSVQDAAVEMFLLAACQVLVGTYFSSFSTLAALLGNGRCLVMESTTPVADEFALRLRWIHHSWIPPEAS